MKKRNLAIYFFLCVSITLGAQEIEKLGIIGEIKYEGGFAGGSESPVNITVDEINLNIEIPDKKERGNGIYSMNEGLERKGRTNYFSTWYETYYKLQDYLIETDDTDISIRTAKKNIYDGYAKSMMKSGISFILKKGDGYIVYYVNDKGIPGAVDTEGNIYGNTEAMEYLKTYDKTKYEASRKRAEELGLSDSFDKADVLVWGQTYYSTVDILEKYWKPETYLYPNSGNAIQYDVQGNGYMHNFRYEGKGSNITIVSANGRQIAKIQLFESSKILQQTNGGNYSASTYVGFGGNIYYYIAGEEYTEVFRIRRTWGEPDLYAMAVNGYTEDSYGTYVKETISKLSKAELRLLRNTLFALYGYTFKSEDLKNHFDKQVWYTDGNKTMNDIVLPAHRQKLLELVQAEENLR